ncbi:MAG: HD domain-containing phosphohydrolase, partial [Thermoanaerobaculia bacterium]
VLTATELQVAGDALRAILLIPGAVAAMFSAFGHAGGVQEIAARSTFGEEARNLLQSKLSVWLSKRGEAAGYVTTTVTTPFGTSAPPVTSADVQKVFTAALAVGTVRGLYLTVAFAGVPDRTSHELLAVLHANMQIVLEQSIHRSTVSNLRTKVAEKLLEPDFSRYPHLRRHSDAVSRLAEGFARFLSLGPAEVETARLAALVHDAGMRLLDYDRLYRKNPISEEELSMLREHVSVGAAVIEPLLGPEIARIVLCHHERSDGRGYPNGLHSDEIPPLSKVVQLCEAYVAMVDPESYQVTTSPENALSAIARGAGEQFDAELAPRFIEYIRTQPAV